MIIAAARCPGAAETWRTDPTTVTRPAGNVRAGEDAHGERMADRADQPPQHRHELSPGGVRGGRPPDTIQSGRAGAGERDHIGALGHGVRRARWNSTAQPIRSAGPAAWEEVLALAGMASPAMIRVARWIAR